MARTKTSVQLAHEMWPRLIVVAETRGIIMRETLAQRFGISGRVLRDFDSILAPLEAYCQQHALPPLHVLIVRKGADVSGDGTDAAAEAAEAVYAYKWRERSPVIPSEDDFAAALTWREQLPVIPSEDTFATALT